MHIKKTKEERRKKMLAAFVSEAEYREAKREADELHLPLSNYLRLKVFSSERLR